MCGCVRDATWVKKGVRAYVTDIELVGEGVWMDSMHRESTLGCTRGSLRVRSVHWDGTDQEGVRGLQMCVRGAAWVKWGAGKWRG